VTVAAGDRVLVKDQTDPTQNGIYVAAAGTWTRATDMAAWTDVPAAYCFVEEGTANADTGWECSSDQGGTLGTTPITWIQFSSAGQATAGNGISKTGNVFAAVADPAGGLQVTAAGIGLAPGAGNAAIGWPLLAPNGIASAPSYGFAASTTAGAGMWSPGI